MYMNTDLISVSNMSKRITNIKYSIITHVYVFLPQIQFRHYLKDQLLPYSIHTLSICNLKIKKHWNKMYMYSYRLRAIPSPKDIIKLLILVQNRHADLQTEKATAI